MEEGHKCSLRRCQKLFVMHFNTNDSGFKRKKHFKCNLCDFKCSNKLHLIPHMNAIHLQVREYKCDICGWDTCWKNSLKNHINAKHSSFERPKFECPKCIKDFKSADQLRQHIISFHDNISCKICDQRFKTSVALKKHVAIDHLKVEPSFQCKICKKKYVLEALLKAHKKKAHKPIKYNLEKSTNNYECDHCGYKCPTKSYMMNHIFGRHLNLRLFKCKLCDFDAYNKCQLTSHMKFKHENVIKCEKCEKLFKSNSEKWYHMRRHESENGYFCEFCNERLQSYNKLEIHIRSKHFHEEESFQCDKCGKKFMLKSKLSDHKNRKHSTPVNCLFEGCHKQFKRKDIMTNHYKNIHLGIKHKKSLECDLCGFKAIAKCKLVPHMNSQHLKVRPYKCHICDYDDIEKRLLNQHIKLFHGPNGPVKYKCPKCEKAMCSSTALRQHIIAIHDGIQCKICDRSFKNEESLQIHHAVDHLKDKESFQCDLCPKKFILKVQLGRHKNSHHKIIKCKFENCKEVFATQKFMDLHYRRIHQKKISK